MAAWILDELTFWLWVEHLIVGDTIDAFYSRRQLGELRAA